MEEEFKAPELICIDNFRGGDYHPFTSEEFTEDDGSCTDYVRKDIAEANTRKAVREVLEKVKINLEYPWYDIARCGEYIDQLLVKYQDPQPKAIE